MTCMGAWRSSKFNQIGPPTGELASLERLEKNIDNYNGKNGVEIVDCIPFQSLHVVVLPRVEVDCIPLKFSLYFTFGP